MAIAPLYVPGDRADRFEKAAQSGTDMVIVDLEDGVAPTSKSAARESVASWLGGKPQVPVSIRINAESSPFFDADLELLAAVGPVDEVRIPKVESAKTVDRVLRVLKEPTDVTCLIESAVGVEKAYELASVAGVTGLGLGELDLKSDLGLAASEELSWIRQRIVVASRAAGLHAPLLSVFAKLDDDDALRRWCITGLSSGFRGCSAIHPRQVSIIKESFRPTPEEVEHARDLLAALDQAVSAGIGVVAYKGKMIDEAMRGAALEVIARFEALRD